MTPTRFTLFIMCSMIIGVVPTALWHVTYTDTAWWLIIVPADTLAMFLFSI